MNKLFNVSLKDYGDTEIEAYDAEDAAQKFAEQYDTEGDYILSSGYTRLVTVTDIDGNKKQFTISAEVSASYYAREHE